MTDLKSQKQMAAKIMKCGVSRVWIDPSRTADVSDAITSQDVRTMVKDGVIKKQPKQGISSYRKKKMAEQKKKGRRKGPGSRKGSVAGTRKREWISRIRAMRRLLVELRKNERIDSNVYRDIYTKARSGFFRSRSHIMIHLERNDLLKEGKKEMKEAAEKKQVSGEK